MGLLFEKKLPLVNRADSGTALQKTNLKQNNRVIYNHGDSPSGKKGVAI